MESVNKSIDKRALHKREYDNRVNERQMQIKEGKVDTSKALDARQQHSKQPEFNNEGEVDQNVEQRHDKRPLSAKLTDNKTTELSNQSLDSENIFTAHYLPNESEYAIVKPHHVIASSESGNSSKNMPRFSLNDMVHNHYLDEARKKTQEKSRNSEPSVMPSAKSQSTSNDSKPKPRINNQNSRNWPASKTSYTTTKTVPIAEHSRNSRNFSDTKKFVCSTCQKCVFNANHESCVTKFLNEVNSRAKVPSNKKTNRNKPVEKISIAKKLERQIPTRHRFSIKNTSTVHEKTTSPRSCLRWKQTGKIFKTVGLRWLLTRNIFTSSINSEPPHGSNTYITNLLECIQTLNSSAGSNTLRWKPHQGGSYKLNLPDHRYKQRCCSLNLAKSNSLPHAHAQSIKTYYWHQNARIKKAQVHTKTKTSANSYIQDLPLRYQVYQWRLLASFQDDAKYEHVGQDTRSQDGKDDQDIQGKDLKISEQKTKSKDNDKGPRSNITQHEGTSLQQDKDQDKDSRT
ncbi:hypothetical protein Tco_0153195 [Tanacetum coccineum]